MRRLLYLAALSMLILLVSAPAALAQQELDPVAQLRESGAPVGPTQEICSGFASQEAAQEYYNSTATPEEQAIMDPNGDGLACTGGDLFTAATDQYAAPVDQYAAPADQYTPAADQYAAPTDDTATLPATGGPALLLAAGVLLLGTGLLGLRLVRRS